MNLFKSLYLAYFFLVRKDKYFRKSTRARFLLETVFYMISCSTLFIAYGAFNIRTNSFLSIFILIIAAFTIATGLTRLSVGNGKETEYIKSSRNVSKSKKKMYGIFGVLMLLISFVVL